MSMKILTAKTKCLNPKMYLFLVDNNEHKKTNGVNKNAVATIGNNKFKDVFLKNKCLRHLLNKIQSKDRRIGAYEIKKKFIVLF